jgi:hypothetical protein
MAIFSLRFHTFVAFLVLAIIAITMVGGADRFETLRAALADNTADIGIEHTLPLSLQMEFGEQGGKALLHVIQESEETITMSIPSGWERGEVSGVTLDAVKEVGTTFGFTQWQIPGQSSVYFRIPQTPKTVVIHSPSDAPLKIFTTRANLDEGTVERDVVLIHDTPVPLW